jgi:hypothetical protein
VVNAVRATLARNCARTGEWYPTDPRHLGGETLPDFDCWQVKSDAKKNIKRNTLGWAMQNLKTRFFVLLLSTLSLSICAYAQFTPSGDSYTVAEPAKYRSHNYGTKPLIDVDGNPAATSVGYVQFDLSAIPSGYTGANVTKASLKLYVNAVYGAGSFEVYSVNSPWSEDAITYDNAPTLGSVVSSSVSLPFPYSEQYIVIDITSAVQGWVETPASNNGIALVAAQNQLSVSFESKENTAESHPPELDIVFTGAVTSINTPIGSGLMGGGTGNVSLSLTNTCNINQVLSYNGSEWQCSNIAGTGGGGTVTSVGSGTGLTGGPITTIGTLAIDPTVVPQLSAASNNFAGILSAGTVNAANGYYLGSTIFGSGSASSNNAFLGFAGNGTNPGTGNTASGWQALAADTTGGSNVASGYLSLNGNTTGSFNTALGVFAGQTGDGSPMTASNNTFLGAGAEAANGGIKNAAAIGSNSLVGANNALVLGSIAGLNNATFNTNVGIGTTAPATTLDVEAPTGSTPSVNFFVSSPTPGTFTVNGATSITGSLSVNGVQVTGGGGAGITSVTGTNGVNATTSGGAVTLSANEGVVAFQTDLTNGLANTLTAAETFATAAESTAQANADSYANSTFVPLAAPGDLTETVAGTLTEKAALALSLQGGVNMSLQSNGEMSLQSAAELSLQSGLIQLSSPNVTIAAPTLLINGSQTLFQPLGTATASQGYDSGALSLVASSYNSSSGQAVSPQFLWQAEPSGNDTANASGTLNLLFASGANGNPAETGLSIANNGIITFASGQTFPGGGGGGGGTITGVIAGTGLSGGGNIGTVTLNNTGVLNVAPGTGIAIGGTVQNPVVNINTNVVPQLNGGNSFSGNQNVNGNIAAAGTISGTTITGTTVSASKLIATGALYLNGNTTNAFAYESGTGGGDNAFLGFAGASVNTAAPGDENTAVGFQALNVNGNGSTGGFVSFGNTAVGAQSLLANTLGNYNTATGANALDKNTTGNYNAAHGDGALLNNVAGTNNTASGHSSLINTTGSFNTGSGSNALQYNAGGSYNTALGALAGPDSASTGLTYATAIGAGAVVSAPNALVLGGPQGSAAAVNVGIGTATPLYPLDVRGSGTYTASITGNLNVTGTVTCGSGCGSGGGGGITQITAGPGLSGGGSSGNVTLSLNAAAANTFTSTQTINSSTGNGVSATTSSSSGSGLYGAGNGAGVTGTTSTSTGSGVVGANTATSGNAYGVYGQSSSFTGTGVYGTGSGSGVTGSTSTPAGSGVVGVNLATSGPGYGIYGQSNAGTGVFGTGPSYGVYGQSNDVGVYGTGPDFGVYGSSSVIGVYGTTSSTIDGESAVVGNATGLSGATSGVSGSSSSPGGAGVYGVGVSTSSVGSSFFGTGAYGVWGDTDAASGIAVLATTDNDVALIAENDSNAYATVVFTNLGKAGNGEVTKQNSLLMAAYGGNTRKGCTIDTGGTLDCDGTVTAVVPANSGASKVSLYAVQSPENWFEDFGSSELVDGVAIVALDSVYAQTVNTDMEYHVFLTPRGECEGLYVGATTAGSFEVRELHHGTSNIKFDYRIVARRKGYETVRLADKTEQFDRIQRMLPAVEPGQGGKPQPLVTRRSPLSLALRAPR